MAIWISLTIIAHFMNAFVSILDRYIVASGKIGRPIVVTFYVSVLSALGIFAFCFSWLDLPFGSFSLPNISNVMAPSAYLILLSFSAAACFIIALYSLFSAFLLSEASDVVPVVSSISALSTLLFSFYFLNSALSSNFLWGFLFLVLGTFLIAHFRMTKKLIYLCLVTGILFGLNLVLIKLSFNITNFDNAFFWSRFCIAFLSLFILFIPKFHERNTELKIKTKKTKRQGLFLILFNKTLAGISAILILKAVELGDVSIVQALAGIQFVFLVLFSVFLGHKAPKCIGENCETKDKIQKIVSVSIIIVGFSLLFI